MTEIRFYSAPVCPFCQRTHLMLLEKGVDYETIEIDLQNIPSWFLERSPYGKVPLLERGKDRVWESTVINEYLEEVYPTPPMMPSAPGQRAQARIWVNYGDDQFIPYFYKLLLEQDPQQQKKLVELLQSRLQYMEQKGPGQIETGPYWLGSELTLVDLAFYPFFERFPVLKHYRGVSLQPDYPNLLQWIEIMKTRASVQATCHPPGFYIQRYARYADGTASGRTAREIRGEI